MGEKKEIRVSLGTVICIIIITLLLVVIGGMWYYYNYIEDKAPTNEIVSNVADTNINSSNKVEEETIVNKIEEIKLSDNQKSSINKELRNSFILSLREITNFEQNDLTFNKNLLNEIENRYYITWYAMLEDTALDSEFVEGLLEDGTYASGGFAIKKSFLENYYYDIFNEKLNENELLKGDYSCLLSIKNDMLYSSAPTGWGIDPFVLKANKLELNNETKTYTLYVDFLTAVKSGTNREIDYDTLMGVLQPETLTWNNSLNYATLKIEYQKDNANNYTLQSLVFEK